VHGDRLRELAAEAESAEAGGDVSAARDRWLAALELLPAQSQQQGAVRDRVAALTRTIGANAGDVREPGARGTAWWRRGLPGLGVLAILLVSKLKFLLLGLTKASTFVSLFAFFGLYWSMYGWPLALGLALSIYVHEMGHVAMLRRLGLDAGAPLFVPGVGAFVLLKQPVLDPLVDAKIGLAGPVWGLGAGLLALAVHGATGAPIWFAIAQVTGFLNLFNLIPVWQLDGSRGIRILSRGERWALVGVVALALLLTDQRLLFIVGAVAVWRAMQDQAGPGDRRVLATFAALVLLLALLARGVG
jgi:Zn-dependent protease